MFTPDELYECMNESWFVEGYEVLERGLLRYRLGLPSENTAEKQLLMLRFSRAVLGSVTDWLDPRATTARSLCSAAADIEVAMAVVRSINGGNHQPHLLNAAILYELSAMPGPSASYAQRDGFPVGLKSFFSREKSSPWGKLATEIANLPALSITLDDVLSNARALQSLLEEALSEVLQESGSSIQHGRYELLSSGHSGFDALENLAYKYNLPITVDAVRALQRSVELRTENSTLHLLRIYPELDQGILRSIGAPAELWPAQRLALDSGLLQSTIKSFGVAAPTGTGKTSLAQILLTKFFLENKGRRALYISPSRSLASQVAHDLHVALEPLGINVAALGATLTLDEKLMPQLADSDLLIFTPEKADLLMRVEPNSIRDTGLVIVDEAHHIEQGTRGVLLEFYLWRLRSLLPDDARIVQLSAVTPNMSELVDWLAPAGSAAFAKLAWRASKLRLGIFERVRDGSGVIKFGAAAPYVLFPPNECPADRLSNLAQLANKLSAAGIVLVLATSVSRAEKLAEAIASLRNSLGGKDDIVDQRLDARIERELYAESPLRQLYRKRVVFHHAQLPPRVREVVEQAIGEKRIDIVCATTTLSEGVNFPFSTVIVDSLVGKNFELSPRDLWNIAGRAGRFGVDTEGHCILFRPSGWVNKLTRFTLDQYLSDRLDAIPPVRSAFAAAIEELHEAVERREVRFNDLTSIKLDRIKIENKATSKAKRIRGLINVMRVGYAHASQTGRISLLDTFPSEFSTSQLLAARQLKPDVNDFAFGVASQQRAVVREATLEDEVLLNIAAKVGWSLESQSNLYEWLKNREDWQLEQFGNIVRGGRIINFSQLGYLIGPLSTRMSEFEGETLGGIASWVATGWLEGVSLSQIRATHTKRMDFGRLVRVIYARVQYLLPWALFGLSELIRHEASRRRIHVGSGVSDLSALASEGVPSFDALQLVLRFNLERVDATRLADAFHRERRTGDIVDWMKNVSWARVVNIVRGTDQRRLDPDLENIWSHL